MLQAKREIRTMLLGCMFSPFTDGHVSCRLEADDQVRQGLCTHNWITQSLMAHILWTQAQAHCQGLLQVRLAFTPASELRRNPETIVVSFPGVAQPSSSAPCIRASLRSKV